MSNRSTLIRCFVSSYVCFRKEEGPQRYISTFSDMDFIIRDNKLVAEGFSYLRADLGENYYKNITIEVSYSKDTKKWGVNVFWDPEWVDEDDMPITRYAREKASGVCTLKVAEEKAIKCFQKESNEMLERLLWFKESELKRVLKIED